MIPKFCVKKIRKGNIIRFIWAFPIFLLYIINFLNDIFKGVIYDASSIIPVVIIVLITGYNLLVAIRGTINPAKSRIGKYVLLHAKNPDTADIHELFAEVDKDFFENGEKHKGIIIGKHWVYGKTTFMRSALTKIDDLSAIFYHIVLSNRRNEYKLHLMDKNNKDTVMHFMSQKSMEAAYDLLCDLCPSVAKGSHEDWEAYLKEHRT